MSSIRRVLVIGATGKVGRHVVTGLLDRGAGVRALVRRPGRLDRPEDVEIIQGDLTGRDTVSAAAEGADSTFLLWPGFDAAGAEEVVAALARNAGHVVHLSAAQLQDGGDLGAAMPGVWADVERMVGASGVGATFVRAGGFAANTLEWSEQIRGGDTVRLPFAQAGRSPVHERDVADVVVAALLDPEHVGRAYAVTGPATLTQAEQVRTIGTGIGRDLRVEELTVEEAHREMTARAGAEFAEATLPFWASLADRPERVTTDVEQVTGHPARSFAEWVRDHRDDFTATVQEG